MSLAVLNRQLPVPLCCKVAVQTASVLNQEQEIITTSELLHTVTELLGLASIQRSARPDKLTQASTAIHGQTCPRKCRVAQNAMKW